MRMLKKEKRESLKILNKELFRESNKGKRTCYYLVGLLRFHLQAFKTARQRFIYGQHIGALKAHCHLLDHRKVLRLLEARQLPQLYQDFLNYADFWMS